MDSLDELDEILKEFLVESYENLDLLDRELLGLESNPNDRERLSSIFRVIHTIKGTSGFLGLGKLEKVTHVGESLLVLLRDGKLQLNSDIATGLLSMVDAVREIMKNIENGQGEGEGEYSALIANLERLQTSDDSTKAVSAQQDHKVDTTEQPLESVVLEAVVKQVEMLNGHSAVNSPVATSDVGDEVTVIIPKNDQAVMNRIFNVDSQTQASRYGDQIASQIIVDDEAMSRLENEVLKELASHESLSKPDTKGDQNSSDKSQSPSVSESSVRIDVTLLDRLMNLVGELVLTRNQILQYVNSRDEGLLTAASQRLNLITTELQEGVMKTRMQPIQNAWTKLPRIVRDLATSCRKKVQVKMEGAETELDRRILEAIRDPLTHIVRNSVDHGIELPEVRLAKGKPAEGTLSLSAFHDGGQVNIEISDDGGGINLVRVKEKALSQGLITHEQAESMSERELTNLILLPGFSTASVVTNVSGRGVGMDVVKSNVEKIGGTLDIQSVYGEGTKLCIKIPLTMAIVPALMVTCGKEHYAVPQSSLVELIRVEGERVQREIEYIHNTPVYRSRGKLIPLLFLDEQLQLRPERTGSEFSEETAINIVVLNAGGRQFGLAVDKINDTKEIVVKPLGKHLKSISTFAGVTIMGDGTVALILDSFGLAKRASLVDEVSDRHVAQVGSKDDLNGESKETLLLLGIGENQRMAIPLSLVSRLEEFPISSLERSNGLHVIQSNGQIIPLIHLGEALHAAPFNFAEQKSLQVVVYTSNGQSVGVVVDRILDIVETTITIQRTGKQTGVLGSAIVQNRVTDLLDIHHLLASTSHDFFGQSTQSLAV